MGVDMEGKTGELEEMVQMEAERGETLDWLEVLGLRDITGELLVVVRAAEAAELQLREKLVQLMVLVKEEMELKEFQVQYLVLL
jgi:hypothetical protein